VLLILDTDVLTIWHVRSQPAFDRLRERFGQHPDDEVATTILTFQERVQGWQSVVHQARTPARVLSAYRELQITLHNFCALRVLGFDQAAQDRFAGLQKQRLRLGTMDMRIAAVALATGGILLSRNLRDFRKVPGLVVEDWTR
jgi:tRNA(fMet)-specific endonuclease VapC